MEAPRVEEQRKQEIGQTVLIITKALTETTNCTRKAKKWRGTTKKMPALRA